MEITPLEAWILEKAGIPEGIGRDEKTEELRSYQLEKLRKTIAHVKSKSAFYKKMLGTVSPDEIASFEDFERLPFTTSSDIMHNPLAFICVSQSEVERIVSLQTSGTQGEAKRIYFTADDQQLTIDFFSEGMKGIVDEGDKVLIMMPGGSPGSVGSLLREALSRLNVESHVYGPLTGDAKEAIDLIMDKGMDCIVGIPVQVVRLKRENEKAFADNIKSVLLSTDYVPQAIIDELSDCGCRVFTHYGMTEMGLGGGVECSALEGYHMREADLYFEIVDPATGKRKEDGEYGEIVFTTLTRTGMPLVRYRTGDEGRFLKESCRCSTALRTMERVLGRMGNSVEIIPGTRLRMRDLDEILLKRKEIFNYEARVLDSYEKEAGMIEISVEMEKGKFECERELIAADLLSCEAVAEAVGSGLAGLEVKLKYEPVYTGKGTFKRMIRDSRKRGLLW